MFASAFDDTFLYRYDANTRVAKERIDVRYIVGPKQRILHDLNDKAKTLTLPVVTIQQTSFSKDLSRVFNKGKKFKYQDKETNTIYTVPTPVPVNLEIQLSIICKFKEDLDQILQNFTSFCNPYIIVSWKEPEKFGLPFLNEIRTEIQWSGEASIESYQELSNDQKWRITADTNFTIKGWIFPPHENQIAPIYYIDNNFKTVGTGVELYDYDNYNQLSAAALDTDTITVSAIPHFTNAFYTYESKKLPIYDNLVIDGRIDNRFTFYGDMFDRTNSFYLSSNKSDFYTDYQLISTAKSPLISGYKIPDEWIYNHTDDMFSVVLSANILSSFGEFRIITANEAGWAIYPNYNIYNWVSGAYELYYQPGGQYLYFQPDGESLYINYVTLSEVYS